MEKQTHLKKKRKKKKKSKNVVLHKRNRMNFM